MRRNRLRNFIHRTPIAILSLFLSAAIAQARETKRPPEFVAGNTPPELEPLGPGSGVWKSQTPQPQHQAWKKWILQVLEHPVGKERFGREARLTLLHYFQNSGEDFPISVSALLQESKSAREDLLAYRNAAIELANSLAPGSYEFVSPKARIIDIPSDDSRNWYKAVGSYHSWVRLEIQIERDDARTTRLRLRYHVWDPYDWDPGKTFVLRINAPPEIQVRVSSDFMAQFHRQGLAREFFTVGAFELEYVWGAGKEPAAVSKREVEYKKSGGLSPRFDEK